MPARLTSSHLGRGESEESIARSTQARIHPGFKIQGRRLQKSKTGISMVPQKTDVLQKTFKKFRQDQVEWKIIVIHTWLSTSILMYKVSHDRITVIILGT